MPFFFKSKDDKLRKKPNADIKEKHFAGRITKM